MTTGKLSRRRYNHRIQSWIFLQCCWGISLVIILSIPPICEVHAFPTNKAKFVSRNRDKVDKDSLSFRASTGGTLFDNVEDDISICDASTSTSSSLDWSFLDSVYLIRCANGDIDGNRIRSTERVLRDVNLLDNVVVKDFETDDEDRVRGCYTSHVSIFRDSVESDCKQSSRMSSGFNLLEVFQKKKVLSNDQNVLIFEDNVNLGNKVFVQDSLDAISNFIQNNENKWDVIHLAYIPYVPDLQVSKTNDKNIVKLSTSNKQSALGTTAYIINSRAMKRIVAEDDKNGYTVSIPDAMADLFGDSRYALNPAAFVRAPATKSLINPQLDDLRSILFRPTVVAFVQQILVVTGLSTTVLLPIVVLMLVITSIVSATSTIHAVLDFTSNGTLDGPLLFPVINALFSLFSLGLITQGILLAPAPGDDEIE